MKTKRKSCCIHVRIVTQEPRNIIIVGFDPKLRNTEYFFRLMPINGVEEYEFGMPLSPDHLHIALFDLDSGEEVTAKPSTYKVLSIRKKPLKASTIAVNKHTSKFMVFSQRFALKAGFLPSGEQKSYTDPDRIFLLKYFDEIMDLDKETGRKFVVQTPARIHKLTDTISVSAAEFRKMTIPNRIVILTHEYSHNFLNWEKDSEIEADMNALKLYLSMGFPVMEAVYGFTKVFQDTNENIERLEYINAFLLENQREVERKEVARFVLAQNISNPRLRIS